jgi:LysM repeat protein
MLNRLLTRQRLIAASAAVILVVFGLVIFFAVVSDDSEADEGSIRVSEVVLARSVTADFVAQGTTFTFPTNARQIWAVVGLENVQKSVTVTGSWSYLGPTGKADAVPMAEASVEVEVDPALFKDNDPKTPNPSRRSSLSLNKATDFDAGVYELKVLVNGKQAKVLQFNVVPPNQIASTSPTAAPAPSATAAPSVVATATATVRATVAPTATRAQSVQGTVTTATPEPTEPPPPPTETPVPTATTVPGTYVVKQGDSLAGIAAQHGTTVQILAAANNITNPDSITPGQVLVIPTPPPSR